MYIIKMNENKCLYPTKKTSLIQGEKNADTLLFLLPSHYEDKIFLNCKAIMNYCLPSNMDYVNKKIIEIKKDSSNRCICETKIPCDIMNENNNIILWLEIVDINNNFLLKTKTTTLHIIADDFFNKPFINDDWDINDIDETIYFGE